MAFAIVLGALLAGAGPAPCPIDRAVYRLHGAPAFTAGFARQDRRKTYASDLVFWLKTPKRTYWFALSTPNGYGGTYLYPDVDPKLSRASPEPLEPPRPPEGEERLSIEFDAFAADRSAFRMPPQLKNRAPAFLFARGLGPALSYSAVELAAGDPKAEMESMPIGLFDRFGCAPAAHR
jgi:hypothetical protein